MTDKTGLENKNTPDSLDPSNDQVAAEKSSADIQDEIMHKRKAYRIQQEEKRKLLKTQKFEEKDDSVKLPKVSFFFFLLILLYTSFNIIYQCL